MLLKTSIFCTAISSLLLVASSSSIAQEKVLYKKVDKNGRIVFTDKPIAGSKKVVVDTSKNLLSIPRPKPKIKDKNSEVAQGDKSVNAIAYDVLEVEKPASGESVRANDGSLYVIIALSPMLDRNHSIRVLLDGEMVGSEQKVPYFSLTGIDRGAHQISAQVIDDESGEVIQTSKQTKFNMLRASRLNRR